MKVSTILLASVVGLASAEMVVHNNERPSQTNNPDPKGQAAEARRHAEQSALDAAQVSRDSAVHNARAFKETAHAGAVHAKNAAFAVGDAAAEVTVGAGKVGVGKMNKYRHNTASFLKTGAGAITDITRGGFQVGADVAAYLTDRLDRSARSSDYQADGSNQLAHEGEQQVSDQAHAVVDPVVDGTKDVYNRASFRAGQLKDELAASAEETKRQAVDAKDAAADRARAQYDAVQARGQAASDDVTHNAHGVKEDTKGAARSWWGRAEKTAAQGADKTADQLQAAADRARDRAHRLDEAGESNLRQAEEHHENADREYKSGATGLGMACVSAAVFTAALLF